MHKGNCLSKLVFPKMKYTTKFSSFCQLFDDCSNYSIYHQVVASLLKKDNSPWALGTGSTFWF